MVVNYSCTVSLNRWTLPCKVKDAKDWDVPWSLEDDSHLLAGVFEYGFGSWEAIKMDPTYGLADKVCFYYFVIVLQN